MSENPIHWDAVPDVLSKEQLRKLCHISKNTARILLRSGKIPCIDSGRQTRCYKILKKDVITYLARRDTFPEFYSISDEGRSRFCIHHDYRKASEAGLQQYYTYLLREYPDVLDSIMISNMTEYSKTAINHWCKLGLLQHFKIAGRNRIPKPYLIDFLSSEYCCAIARKSNWHKQTLMAYLHQRY